MQSFRKEKLELNVFWQEERVAMELKDLRNKMSFAYFLLNAIFVVFIFTMQQNTDKVKFRDIRMHISRVRIDRCSGRR